MLHPTYHKQVFSTTLLTLKIATEIEKRENEDIPLSVVVHVYSQGVRFTISTVAHKAGLPSHTILITIGNGGALPYICTDTVNLAHSFGMTDINLTQVGVCYCTDKGTSKIEYLNKHSGKRAANDIMTKFRNIESVKRLAVSDYAHWLEEALATHDLEQAFAYAKDNNTNCGFYIGKSYVKVCEALGDKSLSTSFDYLATDMTLNIIARYKMLEQVKSAKRLV